MKFWVHGDSTRCSSLEQRFSVERFVEGSDVIKPTRTYRRFLRTIASTAVSGIGQWDRLGQDGADLCLTCRGEDGRRLISVNQFEDGHVEVFVSSTLDRDQYVTAHEGLRSLHIDPDVLGDGIDDSFANDLKPPLFDASDKILSLARSLDGIGASSQTVSDGVVSLRLCNEDGETHSCFLVANEAGHFCYYRTDIFDLGLAMIAAIAYQTGFHLCMLSKSTGIHPVKAFNGTQQDVELLAFKLSD